MSFSSQISSDSRRAKRRAPEDPKEDTIDSQVSLLSSIQEIKRSERSVQVEGLRNDLVEIIDQTMTKQTRALYHHIAVPVKDMVGDLDNMLDEKLSSFQSELMKELIIQRDIKNPAGSESQSSSSFTVPDTPDIPQQSSYSTLDEKKQQNRFPAISKAIRNHHKVLLEENCGWFLKDTFSSEYNQKVTNAIGDYIWLNYEALTGTSSNNFSPNKALQVKEDIRDRFSTHFTHLKDQTKGKLEKDISHENTINKRNRDNKKRRIQHKREKRKSACSKNQELQRELYEKDISTSDIEQLLSNNSYMSAEDSEDDGTIKQNRVIAVQFPLYRSPKVKNIIDTIDKYVPSQNSAYKRVKKYVYVDIPKNVLDWMVRPNYKLPDDGFTETYGEELEDIEYHYDSNI